MDYCLFFLKKFLIYIIFKGDEHMIKFALCDDNVQVLSKLKEMLEKIFLKYDYRSHNSVYCI